MNLGVKLLKMILKPLRKNKNALRISIENKRQLRTELRGSLTVGGSRRREKTRREIDKRQQVRGQGETPAIVKYLDMVAGNNYT